MHGETSKIVQLGFSAICEFCSVALRCVSVINSTVTFSGSGRKQLLINTRDLRTNIWQRGRFTAMSVCTTNPCKSVISIPTGADRWVSVSGTRSGGKW